MKKKILFCLFLLALPAAFWANRELRCYAHAQSVQTENRSGTPDRQENAGESTDGQENSVENTAEWENGGGDLEGQEEEKAPELLAFTAEGTCVQLLDWEDKTIPLLKAEEGADIRFSFVIEEGREEWNAEALELWIVSLTDGKTVAEFRGDSRELIWYQEGGKHRAEFSFDGEEEREDVYQLLFRYSDRNGQSLQDGRTGTDTGTALVSAVVQEEDGLCASSPFALDHAAPSLQIIWPEAVRVVEDGKDCRFPGNYTADGTFYYNKEVTAEIILWDSFLGKQEGGKESGAFGPENFTLKLWSSAETQITNPREIQETEDVTDRIRWSMTESGEWKGSFTVSEEGDFRFQAFYKDRAGNSLRAEEEEAKGVPLRAERERGGLESPVLVLDRTAPVLRISYTEAPVSERQGRKYFNAAVKLCLTIEDRNFRVQELKEILQEFSASDSTGKERREETELYSFLTAMEETEISRESWTVELPLSVDANYSIPVSFTDLAGNQLETAGASVEYLTVDREAPENFQLVQREGISAPYRPAGWIFARDNLDLQLSVRDGTAGIREIRFIITDEEGKEITQTHNFEPSSKQAFELTLPLEGENFRGAVQTEVYDWAGNCLTENRGCIVENRKRHEETAAAQIETLTEPSRTVDGVRYYNTDVVFQIRLEDWYSGLGKVQYSAGTSLSGACDYTEEAESGWNNGEGREISHEFCRELTLGARANNENGVPVQVFYSDNAGHTGRLEQQYHIDVTVPEISVTYDLNEPVNGRYFHQARTATVTIRERNFDERDVEFHITNPEGRMPEISGWTSSGSGDDTLHVCTVVFREDGDYLFFVEFQDLAGNRAVSGPADLFTIDQTVPELTVSWDNTDSRNGMYYAESRTARLEILDDNFGEENIHVTVIAESTALDAEETERVAPPQPVLSEWKKEEDRYTATAAFLSDGQYMLEITGEDLAGNPMKSYESGPFIIDQTPPEIAIFDLENHSANSREVSPRIRYTDANWDPDSEEFSLTGYLNGKTQWNGSRTAFAGGMELKLENMAYIQDLDDMYTLETSVQDLAGNRSTARISFSVNRFGSVYTFDEMTGKITGENGEYFTNHAQELVITETNVDTLEFCEIICSHDGSLRTLQEGTDYTVEESGGFPGWKQYTYRIGRKNFEQEGNYLVTIYSEDRASNVSDTGTKGKKLEFAVDRTAPVILISGAEDGGKYRENERELILDIQDNLYLKEAAVTLNGERMVYSARELEEKDGRILLKVKENTDWQELSVTACDAAGNEAEELRLRMLVTRDALSGLAADEVLWYSIAAAPVFLITGILCRLHIRTKRENRRKIQEKTEEKDL